MKSPTGAAEANPPAPPKKRVGPITFLTQVRQEARKVTWTTPRETYLATVMVLIMVLAAAVFFYLTDSLVRLFVSLTTGFHGGNPPNG